jgi:hypothetical protein
MSTPAYQQMVFVNLPVSDLDASKKFFTELGYSLNPQFSDENAASVVISDNIIAMLLTKPFYSTFTKKEIADATKTSRTTASCTAVPSTTSTATPGRSSGWTRRRSRADPPERGTPGTGGCVRHPPSRRFLKR